MKGKLSCWKIFIDADEVTFNTLAELEKREQPSIGTMAVFLQESYHNSQKAKLITFSEEAIAV